MSGRRLPFDETAVIELAWNGPIGEAKLARIIEALPLTTGARTIDFGCGCGEVLIRVHERHDETGVGIDVSAEHVDEARRRVTGRVRGNAIRFEVADAARYDVESGSVDLAICLGSTHAFGLGPEAYANAISRMRPMLAPGGVMLVADGYARKPADPEYRERCLGETTPDTQTHAANVAVGRDAGLVPLGAWTSSTDEWDDFEWGYQRIVERRAAEHPDDPRAAERLTARRAWMQDYLRWGRETLGYGVYLFQQPATAAN